MKYIIPVFSALILIASCKQQTTETAQANPERDSLIQLTSDHEESINQFIASFNEIERNLDSVAVKQNIINMNSEKVGRDLKPAHKERIIAEIKAINQLMEENNEKIEGLKKKLARANKKNSHLDETIAILTNQLAQKNDELMVLNERLNTMDMEIALLKSTVDTLRFQNNFKSATINDNVAALHTAYYVIGKTKELQEAKLIDKAGGLLGIGRTPKLSENFDKEKFTRIDYTQISTIPVNSDGVKIITVHPSDSYTLDKDKNQVKNIVITNAEKFWSASKYLVIIKS
ncbi:MAG: hypothetical protein H7141_07950 [Burkholderiales bacterium]|nr:hypothetical protein [Bacteroidia bacterium]